MHQTATVGQTATFTVSASGTAPLGQQWQKNSTNIAGATSSSATTRATARAGQREHVPVCGVERPWQSSHEYGGNAHGDERRLTPGWWNAAWRWSCSG
ncbi:MAG: hypothetical protein IPI01_20710 [Ignavibacteriae bacterium]|nr:hypothetical protein [Ignavibacteriota bacterium]